MIQVVQAQSFMFSNKGISGSNSYQDDFRAAGQSSTLLPGTTKMMMMLMIMKEEIDMPLIIPLLMMNKNMPSENMNLDEMRKLKMLLCNNEDTEQVQP